MNDLAIFSTFARGEQTQVFKGTNCVIYTRVSSDKQTHNLSLTTQFKYCYEYAERQRYTIIKHFGGTSESATTDNERKEFSTMVSYVKKSKEKISFILVASLERFSRNENSIWLSSQLRTLGVEIVSVTQPIDTSNPSGRMHQKMLFVLNEWENELRKLKCVAGMKEMLSRGDWPMRPPLGYNTIIKNSRRTIVINEQGLVLMQAFTWKLEGVTYEEISQRLATQGIKLCRQRVAAILRNPFYCGLLANTLLEGKIIKGNHEPLISQELFLRVNGLLEQNTHGYTITEENDHLPLKRFLKCDCCGKPLRGYIVQKKRIHYYKCSTYGCNTNRNAKVLHERFMSVLEYFSLDKVSELVSLVKKQTIATFNQYTKVQEDSYQLLQSQYKAMEQKIERLEERFIEEEITAELYNKFRQKFTAEKLELEQSLAKASDRVSNLEECIDRAIEFATKLPLKWREAGYTTKQRLQTLLFPDGILYNRGTDECRTTRINSVFLYMAYIKQVMTGNKKGIPELNLDYAFLSCSVARRGIEPLFEE